MDIQIILIKNYKDAQWLMDGEHYAGLTWLSDTPKPTEEELKKQWADVKYQQEIEEIKQLRQLAYVEEADPIFFESQRNIEVKEATWLEKIEEIKARYPYPSK
jgi:hypothetical protein